VNAQSPRSLASVDGEIMPLADATISIADDGLVRGDGAFEVMRVYEGRPFGVEEHLARLDRSTRNLRLPVDLEAVRAEAYRLIAQAGAGPDHDLLRIMITRGGRRLMMTERLPDTPMKLRLKTITYGPTRILDGIKSLSYASNMLAGRMAREHGFDDALLVTPHGRVLEAPTSSIFWVKDGELLTPPLDDHILASITRAVVLEVTGAQERSCPLEQLVAADEVFIASTTREVQPVVAVDGHEFPGDGPVTAQAAAVVSERIQAALTR
jgi:branched-chain amino acid aminotransferase